MRNSTIACVVIVIILLGAGLFAVQSNTGDDASDSDQKQEHTVRVYVIEGLDDPLVDRITVTDGERIEEPDYTLKNRTDSVIAGWEGPDGPWDFENDVVTEDMSLFAEIEYLFILYKVNTYATIGFQSHFGSEARIDWGDGTVEFVDVVHDLIGHTYSDRAKGTVRVTIYDPDGTTYSGYMGFDRNGVIDGGSS